MRRWRWVGSVGGGDGGGVDKECWRREMRIKGDGGGGGEKRWRRIRSV